MKHAIVLSALMLAGTGAFAEDRLKLDEANIQGASELPKVLYIVPWKKADVKNAPVELNRMVDEIISPVDRQVLKRQIQFYENRPAAQ
jgi:hypothetical protein